MIDLIGILSGLLIALSGVPQAWATYKAGRAEGISLSFIALLLSGIATLSLYVLLKYGFDPIIHGEHAISLSMWGIILRYRFFPRRS